MRKKLLVTGLALASFISMHAGGLLTNTNQNVAFLRNPARGASIEIDAAYTNPAGLAFLKKDGFFLSLNNQSAFQTRTITADFAPFAGFGGSAVKEFEGKAKALVIPNLQAAYKTGNWVFSTNIGVVGGGGSLDFSKGLPSFESKIAAPIAQLSGTANIPTTYSLDSRLEGSSMTLGVQLGATYKINDMFSAYIGGRVNIVNNGYKGYLRNVSIAQADNLTAYFTGAASMANGVVSNLQSAINGGFGEAPLSALGLPEAQIAQMAAGLKMTAEQISSLSVKDVQGAFSGLATQATGAVAGIAQLTNTNLNLDAKQTGIGVAPIIGFHYNWDRLNIGIKYEFKTGLELKNDTKENSTGVEDYNDKVTTPYDIPALFTVGAQYDILPQLTVSAGYHHFFDSNAKMAHDKQKFINGGINEYLAGVEYRINDMFLVSCGTQFTRTGVTDDYQSDMNFSLNSYSLGFGGAINITKDIRVNLAYFFTNYDDWTKNPPVGGTIIGGEKDTFGRTNKAFGIGMELRF